MLKVLLVEDCSFSFDLINESLYHYVKVMHADTVTIARNYFARHKIDAIILGFCMTENGPELSPLMQEILGSNFPGPVIASFTDPADYELLFQAGATHVADKFTIAATTLQELGF